LDLIKKLKSWYKV